MAKSEATTVEAYLSELPPEKREHVFERFHRGEKGGSGLGLTIAKQVVTRHGGRIAVRGREADGLEVSMVLPQ